jgi:transposase
VKSSIVTDAIRKEISFEERLKVREITLDMSPTMDFIVGELFPQAKRTLDRFHVTKNVLEDIQAIRTRIKTLIKDEELEKEEQCKIDRKKYIPRKFENSETRLEFITRLRYQLFERRKDWGDYQIKRWEVLKIHPELDEIRVSYELLEKFYEIYDAKI